MESRLQQPNFGRGRRQERGYVGNAVGNGAFLAECPAEKPSSLPPIGNRRGVAGAGAESMLPRPGIGRSRSLEHSDAPPARSQPERGPRSCSRGDGSLPPLSRGPSGSLPPAPRPKGQVEQLGSPPVETPPQRGGRQRPPRPSEQPRDPSPRRTSAADATVSTPPRQDVAPGRARGQKAPPPLRSGSREPIGERISVGDEREVGAELGQNGGQQRANSNRRVPRPPSGGVTSSPRAKQYPQPAAQRQEARPPVPSVAARQERGRQTSERTARTVQAGGPAERPTSPPIPTVAAKASSRPASPPIAAAAAAARPFVDVDLGAAPFLGEEPVGNLMKCPNCNRSFAEAPYARHVQICGKEKQRKQFNAKAQFVPEEALKLQQAEVRKGKATRRGPQPGTSKPIEPQKPNWRAKSEAFRAAVRQGQMVTKYQKQGKDLRDLPPPPAADPELDDRVPCPHCGRRFGQQQAERHIPHCKNTKAKPGGILRAAPRPGGAAAAPKRVTANRQR